jgi:hypothetical protein
MGQSFIMSLYMIATRLSIIGCRPKIIFQIWCDQINL